MMPNATQRGFEGFKHLNQRNKVLGGTGQGCVGQATEKKKKEARFEIPSEAF